MTRFSLLLLVGVAACDPGGAIEPTSDVLPSAESGVRLPFPAPQSDGLFPQIAWDSNSMGIFLPDRPSAGPTTVVRFGLESGSVTPLVALHGGLQVLAGGGGSVFYTQSMATADVLSRVGGDDVTSVTAVQFAVSRNGRWIVIRDSGWVVMDLATGARRAVPAIPEGRLPLAVDSTGSHVAFGLIGPLSEYDLTITVADIATGTTRSIATPGERLLAVEFIGDRPILLAFASRDSAGQSELSFVSRSDLPNSTRVLGTVSVEHRDWFLGVCGAWSPDAGYGVGVVQVRFSGRARERHVIVKLDTTAQVIGTANLRAPTDCTLSPNGKWFVYGNATGYTSDGDLYLKAVR